MTTVFATVNDETFGTLLTSDQAATLLGVERTRIKQLDRDNQLVVIRRAGKAYVPARMVEAIPADQVEVDIDEESTPATHRPLWNLRGTVTLLRDAGFDSEEIVAWLWTHDDELGASPIAALEANQHHHVNRIAGTLGF